MSKKSLSISVVVLAVLLLALLIFVAVQYEKYKRLYSAIMVATNDPMNQIILTPASMPVAGKPESLLAHGIYGAQQFAKKLAPAVTLPDPLVPVLQSSDAGFVIATVPSDPTVLYVLYRGTLFDYEWKHDFNYIQTVLTVGSVNSTGTKARVHKGFQNMYRKYQPYIVSAIKKYEPKVLWVAGHSLGAALTVLTALDVSDLVPTVHAYTFAGPKVGNADFVTLFNSLTNVDLQQFVNDADVVPWIPLSVMPNAWLPSLPLYYEHIQADKMHTFYVNNKSWQNNHSLVLHMAYVDGLLSNIQM
jgi:hypothetical protein